MHGAAMIKLSAAAILFLVLSLRASAEQDAVLAWPHAEDVPEPSSPIPGMAGEKPYDIVRYLLTRGPRSVSISPDGRRLAFLSGITGQPQLFVIGAGGAWPTQLTFGRAVTSVAWAPDSERLIYAADRDGNERAAGRRGTARERNPRRGRQ